MHISSTLILLFSLTLMHTLPIENTSGLNPQTTDMGIFDWLFANKGNTNNRSAQVDDPKQLMPPDRFWSIIKQVRQSSFGNYDKLQNDLTEKLKKLSTQEIVAFDNTFRMLRGKAYHWDLWAAAYIINGGCSDDCFSDFRGYLIGCGEEIYKGALKDAETLAEHKQLFNDGDWEGLSYVADEVFMQLTGEGLPEGYSENFEVLGEEWSEEGDELQQRFPELCKVWSYDR